MILPNWNSLDSVREAHSDLELCGLVFFALLVGAEAAAHNSKQEKRKHLFDSIGIWFFAVAISCELAGYWYGLRNDALSEQVISSLDVKARNADTKAQSALDKSSTADTKATAVGTKADALDGKLQTANSQLEAVEAKRAKLEESLNTLAICTAPRTFDNWAVGKQTFADPLRPYARHAIVEFIIEPEAYRAARNLGDALKTAGWSVDLAPIPPKDWDKTPDGVYVYPYDPPLETFSGTRREDTEQIVAAIADSRNSSSAVDKVVEFLQKHHWEVRRQYLLLPKKILPNDIDITIGLYPAHSFITPPADQEFALGTAKEMEEGRKASEKMHKEDEEQLFKHFTPQQITQYKAANEKREKDNKEWMEREYGPCRSLSPFGLIR